MRIEIPATADQINFYDSSGNDRGSIEGLAGGISIKSTNYAASNPYSYLYVFDDANQGVATLYGRYSASVYSKLAVDSDGSNANIILNVYKASVGASINFQGLMRINNSGIIFDFATDDLTWEDAVDTGGTDNGYITIDVGGTTRYIRLNSTS
jgi:hypothetical protein